MVMMDKVPVNGVFDADMQADYEAKAPYLLTMIQNEICRIAPLYASLSITATTDTGYRKLTLPSNYISVYQLLDSELNPSNDYKTIGDDIYVMFDFVGSLIYSYIPTSITAITDDCAFNDIIASTIIATGLGANLSTIENADLSNFLSQKYEELKRDLKVKQSAFISPIKDVYGANCQG
jgi:hypothetical protein